MSPKKKKNVPSATEQKPEDAKPEAPVPEVVISEPQVHVEAPKPEPTPSYPSIKDVLANVDKSMLKMVPPVLIQWAVGIETNQQAIIDVLKNTKIPTEEGIAAKIMEKAQQQRTAAAQQTQQNPEAAPKAGIDIGGIIQAALSGGGSSPLQDKMNKVMDAILDKQLASINQPDKFSLYFDEEIAKAKAKAMAKAIISPES